MSNVSQLVKHTIFAVFVYSRFKSSQNVYLYNSILCVFCSTGWTIVYHRKTDDEFASSMVIRDLGQLLAILKATLRKVNGVLCRTEILHNMEWDGHFMSFVSIELWCLYAKKTPPYGYVTKNDQKINEKHSQKTIIWSTGQIEWVLLKRKVQYLKLNITTKTTM